ncbi:hypothetical protein CEP54_014682 [Fusarium duplospermum]|uniref:Uncharacterized protein n=1 Tax=Fusarium duplospermum TaxID=1325734 RepID=A0A428NUJ9_9HYPO|nr:hypothetical protein CEP54_014682 [Fusarium duplospermum]
MPPILRPRFRASDEGQNATPDSHSADDDTCLPDDPDPAQHSAPVDHIAPDTSVISDGNEPRDSDDLVRVPHPQSGFRVIRFTVGLVNQGASSPLDSQPIELCFHSDFEASARRPLSLHFNDTYLISYERPPPLTAPPPPGVIIDLGRVDALPDDPEFLVLVEEQIHRELEESIQRHQQQERQRVMSRMGHKLNRVLLLIQERWGLTIVVLFILLSAMILSSLAPARTKPDPLESHVSIQTMPITQNMTKIALDTTKLCPIILFNAFVYPTIGDAPDTAPLSPHQTLHTSWNITTHLVQRFLLDHFYEQEFKRYWASADSLDAQMRLSSSELWELDSGLRWDDISGTWQRGSEMRHHVSSLWFSLADNLFYFWVKDAIVDISVCCFTNEIGVARLNITVQDEMFLWEMGNKTSTGMRVPRSELPTQLPKTIQFILDTWRKTLANPKALSSSCKVLQDCKEPPPPSAPLTQVVHPVCLLTTSNASQKDKLESLEAWAVSSRDRNLTLEKSREAEYFWPNQTEYPHLFDQIMWLAQLKDAMEHILETARLVADEIPEETFITRVRGWYQGKEGKSRAKERMDDLEQMLRVDMRRQLHDLIVGLEAVGDICHQREILSTSINDLDLVSNWIIDEDETGVLLRKLLHPKEQAKEFRVLSAELTRRQQKLLKYQATWENMGKEEADQGRNGTENQEADLGRHDTENEGGIQTYS